MYNCIKAFMESEKENGLLLLDMPTGFGKTYSSIQYIFDFMTNEKNANKKLFFITTQKKNLPIEELTDKLIESGFSHLTEKIIKLESHIDTEINNYSPSLFKNVPDEIRKTEEFKNFRNDLEFLHNADKGQNSAYAPSVKNNFQKNTERLFRTLLQKTLYKNFPNVDERLLAIKTDSAWQWVGQLYPAVFTREKQVLFMSMSKFICPHPTIVEKTYTFYNTSIVKNALVIIDEFDATKETILSNIIDNGLKEKIDYIELFNHIYASLHQKTFPERLFIPSEARKNGEYSKQSLKEIMKGLKDKADNIFNCYSLTFNHKTDNIENDANNFLFNDHRYISILSSDNRFISIKTDNKDNINRISFTKNNPSDKNSIQILLGKLRGFVSWFQTTVYILALNYYQLQHERIKDGEEEITYESAIHSVLSEFNLGPVYENYLFNQIMMMRIKSKNNIAGSEYDFTIYENGFRYFSFENSHDFEFKSIISMLSFSQTPERILTRLCEKAKVIGVSATATLPSVLCNYDLNYLSTKMGSAFSHISDDDFLRLSKEFENAQYGYKDITIHTELFDGTDYSVSLWNKIFNDDELSEAAHRIVDISLADSTTQKDNFFNHGRYFKIALAFKRFIDNTDIRSFLCVLNKHPKHDDKKLSTTVLYELFRLITGRTISEVRNMVFLLDGTDFDSKKEELLTRLANGEKLFVISVYQTIGAGQNLHYNIPAELDNTLINVNDRASSNKKDFDAIYLERPSNLTVNLNISNGALEEYDKDFVKFIFETEFLQENAEISEDTAWKYIKRAFEKRYCGKTYFDKNYRTQSVSYYATKQIIQAIGRMCRTNMKQQNIYVYADAQICEFFQVDIANKRLLNKEVTALIDEIIKYGASSAPMPDLIDKGKLCSGRVNKFINNMLHEDWDEKRMEQWEDLRVLVLKYPTATKEMLNSDFRFSQFYIQMDKPSNVYYYSQEEDYSKIEVSYSKSNSYPYEVSEKAAKLDRILMFKGLKESFESWKFATSFAPEEFSMSPALFNNIYKGALGEVCGKFWFKSVLNYSLESIKDPTTFELFDYRFKNLPVYVDFKNWHETTQFNEKESISKVIRKAKECKAECVIIANVLARDNYSTKVSHIDGITLVCCPSLMIDNISSVDTNIEAADIIRKCIENVKNTHE